MINDTQGFILGFLMSGEKSATDLAEIAQEMSPFFNANRSQIYQQLRVLEAGDFILVVDVDKFRGSVYFSVTDSGRKLYDEWLNFDGKPIVVNDSVALRAVLRNPDKLGRLADAYSKMREEVEKILAS